MRRLAAVLLVGLCALTGCGGGHKSSGPLDDALGYFGKDAPFVAAIETDPNGAQIKQIRSLVGRLPVTPLLAAQLQRLTRIRFVNWSRDVRPQLGAPLVVGLARPAAGRDVPVATIVAWRVKHPLRAKQVLLRQPNVRGGAKSSGARIYQDVLDKRYFAVDGDVLVAGSDRDILAHALALRRTDNRMRASGFLRDLRGLPAGGLIRVSADPRQLIGADPRLRPALGVKWIASLRRLGAVVKALPSGATLDFHAATDPRSVTNGDLPLAPKAGPLPLIGGADEVQVGIREPGRLVRVLEQVARAVAPQRVARFRALEPHGIDLERQLPHHLADLAVLAFNPFARAFALRASLHESNDVKIALGQLAPALPALGSVAGFAGLGVAAPAPGESFYALATPRGKTVVFGVIGNSLVAASDARRAGDLASEATHTAPVSGAAVVTLNAKRLAAEFLARHVHGLASLLAPLAVASLRDLTGALTIKRSGVSGHFKLTIVK